MKKIFWIFVLILFSAIVFSEELIFQIEGKATKEKVIKINDNYYINENFFNYFSDDKDNYIEFYSEENNLYDICKIIKKSNTDYEIKHNKFIVKNKITEAKFTDDVFSVKTLFCTDIDYYGNNKKLTVTISIKEIENFELPKWIKKLKTEKTPNRTKLIFELYNNIPQQKEKYFTNDFNINFTEKGVLKYAVINKAEIKKQGKDKYKIILKDGALCNLDINQNPNGNVDISIQNGEIKNADVKYNSLTLQITDNKLLFNFSKIFNITNTVENNDKVILLSPLLSKKLNEVSICLDPGHGGSAPGAGSHDIWEKFVNYNACIFIKEKLEKEGITVILTRELEEDPSLNERGNIAINNKCDFFLSLHCNSCNGEDVASGYESYYHKNLIKSKYFSYAVHNNIVKNITIPNRKSKSDLTLYNIGLGVLRSASQGDIPCTLIEMGFINHHIDRELVQKPEYWEIIANGITEGIKTYLSGDAVN